MQIKTSNPKAKTVSMYNIKGTSKKILKLIHYFEEQNTKATLSAMRGLFTFRLLVIFTGSTVTEEIDLSIWRPCFNDGSILFIPNFNVKAWHRCLTYVTSQTTFCLTKS